LNREERKGREEDPDSRSAFFCLNWSVAFVARPFVLSTDCTDTVWIKTTDQSTPRARRKPNHYRLL